MEDTKQLTVMLTLLLIGVVLILFVLLFVFAVVTIKNKNKKNMIDSKESEKSGNKNTNSMGVNKQSIHKFMDFDTVDDDMIIQDNGKRFLMVVECQGINYDLMSGVEKTGVEQGFLQFLNTLRSPIQIYIQTRTVDLEASIQTYKEKIRKIEEKLNAMQINYERMVDSEQFSKEELDKAFFEITKQENLYEYGKDVVNNTERMSLNRNILNKKYYIIVSYYASELGLNNLDREETKNLVFSELYTRAQSIITSISSCGVKSRILRSNELIELLYMAYNRDEAEVFRLEDAIKAGYDEIYSTAPDVLDKKMQEIDKLIIKKAEEKAVEKVNEVISEKERNIKEKEDKLEELIDAVAKEYIQQNTQYIGRDVAKKAKKKIDNERKTKEGGKEDEEKSITTRGRKPKKTANK